MRKKRLKCVGVGPDGAGDYVFTNPAADAGPVRVGLVAGYSSVALVTLVPRPGGDAEFPIGEGYRVTFPVHVVPGVSSWLLAQFHVVLVEDPMQDPREVTNVRVRVHDGTDSYIWAAGVWSVVADVDADWNTMAEVAHGLVDWPVALSLGLEFELSTTDRRFTPYVFGYTLLYEVDLPSDVNDLLFGALVGGMSTDVRPRKDVEVESDGTAVIAFGAIVDDLRSDWNFVEVVEAFNLTDDPFRKVDILDSYDGGTGTVTLTAVQDAADVILLRVTYAPVVAVTTDQDYLELATSPSILFDRIDVMDRGEAPEDQAIVDEFVDPPIATIIPAPRHVDVDIELELTAPLSVDVYRLAEAVTGWLNDHRVVVSPTTGDQVTTRIVKPVGPISTPDRAGLRTVSLAFQLSDVYLYVRDAYQGGDDVPGSSYAYGVTRVQVSSLVGSASVVTEV